MLYRLRWDSPKTTSCMGSLLAKVGQSRLDSEQKQRWFATVVLDMESRLRPLRGNAFPR